MNKEIKALWLTALRSGDYKQGTGLLHQVEDGGHHFCCLGVLCELAVEAGVTTREGVGEVDGFAEYHYGDDYAACTPPVEVVQWAELPSPAGVLASSVLGEKDVYFSLVSLNDRAKFDFNQIADVIEEQF